MKQKTYTTTITIKHDYGIELFNISCSAFDKKEAGFKLRRQASALLSGIRYDLNIKVFEGDADGIEEDIRYAISSQTFEV